MFLFFVVLGSTFPTGPSQAALCPSEIRKPQLSHSLLWERGLLRSWLLSTTISSWMRPGYPYITSPPSRVSMSRVGSRGSLGVGELAAEGKGRALVCAPHLVTVAGRVLSMAPV